MDNISEKCITFAVAFHGTDIHIVISCLVVNCLKICFPTCNKVGIFYT